MKTHKNPFLKEATINITRTVTEEELDIYTRLFTYPWNAAVLYKLSHAGLRLFTFIAVNLGHNDPHVNLNYEGVTEEGDEMFTPLNLTETDLEIAIQELVKNKIIALHSGNIYWINPDYCFRGDRITTYPSKVDRSPKAIIDQVIIKKELYEHLREQAQEQQN